MGIDAEVDTSQGGDIIQTLKDEIFCSICCAIFEDPLKLDCCDGHLCKVCFEDVKGKFPSCPLCRALNFTAKPSRLMVSVLKNLGATEKDVENSKKALDVLAASKVSLTAEFTEQQTKLSTLQSHYDHLSELFCQGDDTNNCKSCKTKVIDSLTFGKEEETKKETNTEIEKLQSEITRLNRVVTTQRQQQKSARKEIEKRTEEKIKQSYDSKIADLESALKTKNDLSSEFLETINRENSALKADIIALENQIRSFDKPNDTKNNALRTFDKYSQTDVEEPSYPASLDKDSEIKELKNQIARAEQSANLYLEMYEKERKVNQERANEKQGLFGLFKRK
ncbi:Oidioi.mRNA.OKI2018_I69.chr1.g2051.t1.cds [Oikopleura dioica]|uniref:Oidioi.mRNA.OKI2018_I69.chr1.g2051.t1.cds n=1 Tax=Oikopleura dioica TaxID=34765 RepID=A0ABN7SPV5_OIKDI|nr:Oidioi.mRNA.OKI2018_I69.chr1.g2051.t1.cds [Oikopleura dioica]